MHRSQCKIPNLVATIQDWAGTEKERETRSAQEPGKVASDEKVHKKPREMLFDIKMGCLQEGQKSRTRHFPH